MLTAVVVQPPVFGGKVASFNADKARAIKGVRDVVPIPGGIAVVGDGFWPVRQGRDALAIRWDEGPNATFSTERLRERYADLAKQPGVVAGAVVALGRLLPHRLRGGELP